MAFVSRLRPGFQRTVTDREVEEVPMQSMGSINKGLAEAGSAPIAASISDADEPIDGRNDSGVPHDGPVQAGVSDVEGITSTWSKWSLIAVFVKSVNDRLGFAFLLLTVS